AKPQVMAVRTKERIRAGPAPGCSAPPAAAVPTVEKMPAPITAPMPSSVSWSGPSVRRSDVSGASAEARIALSDLVRNSPRSRVGLLSLQEPGRLVRDAGGSMTWDRGEEKMGSLQVGRLRPSPP